MSEQSNDSNTSFKEQLEQILDEYDLDIHGSQNHDKYLTSIINLVDKEVIAELESIRVQQNSHNLDESCCVLCDRIDKKQAIIRDKP